MHAKNVARAVVINTQEKNIWWSFLFTYLFILNLRICADNKSSVKKWNKQHTSRLLHVAAAT